MDTSNTPFRSFPKPIRARSTKKRYKIPPRKDNASTGLKSQLKTMWGYTSQPKMFDALWDKALKEGKGEIICPFTGHKLRQYENTTFWYNCFAHVLPKGQYTYWKLNPNNIRIVYPLFHSIVDNGAMYQRETYKTWDWDAWDRLTEELEKEYELWVKKYT